MLNGREYRNEITDAEVKDAKSAGLIVIFGYSDDNIELRGVIDEEVGAYDGTTFTIDEKGLSPEWDEDGMTKEAAREFFAREGKGAKIEAKWDAEGYSWFITAAIPHAVFDIMEDDEKFCRGIVIDVRDLAQNTAAAVPDINLVTGFKYTLAEAMADADEWIAGATFNADSRGWLPAVALMREEIMRLRPFAESVREIEKICAAYKARAEAAEAREAKLREAFAWLEKRGCTVELVSEDDEDFGILSSPGWQVSGYDIDSDSQEPDWITFALGHKTMDDAIFAAVFGGGDAPDAKPAETTEGKAS